MGEVAGACFCCKFEDLVATTEQLSKENTPDIIIAEPVGSCTDLVATVFSPLRHLHGDRYEVAPLAVLLKPEHAHKILKEEDGVGFSQQAAYIFLKQKDPALLEQVGPRQYRLRAFPIPARPHRIEDEARPLYIWMTISVLAQDGAWPMPQLTEARNVFWDHRTEQELAVPGREAVDWDYDRWLPEPVEQTQKVEIGSHAVVVDGVKILAEPVKKAPEPASGVHLAVVVDQSYSMHAVEDELKAALAQLVDSTGSHANKVDLYLTTSRHRGEDASRILDPQKAPELILYGGQSTAELLRQFDYLRADQSYDGVIVLTDDGSYDLADDSKLALGFQAPVWMVHLGGRLSNAYDDATLQVLQRRGGTVATDVSHALSALGALRAEDGFIVDGLRFRFLELDATEAPPSDTSSFAPIAARQLLLHRLRSASDLKDLPTLDGFHRLARAYPMASPYSSLLVLVNDAQRKMLEEAEKRADRFERETESGVEAASHPTAFLGGDVVGTPEPEEWALILLGLAVLVWEARRWRRRGAILSLAQ